MLRIDITQHLVNAYFFPHSFLVQHTTPHDLLILLASPSIGTSALRVLFSLSIQSNLRSVHLVVLRANSLFHTLCTHNANTLRLAHPAHRSNSQNLLLDKGLRLQTSRRSQTYRASNSVKVSSLRMHKDNVQNLDNDIHAKMDEKTRHMIRMKKQDRFPIRQKKRNGGSIGEKQPFRCDFNIKTSPSVIS